MRLDRRAHVHGAAQRIGRAHPSLICTGTALTPATSAPGLGTFPTSAPGLGSPCRNCTGTWLIPATSARGLGSPLLSHLHRDSPRVLRCAAAIGGRAGREVRSARRRPRRRLSPACAAGRRRYGASPRCAGGSCKQESHSSRSGSIRLERACPSVCSCRNQSAARAAAQRRIAGIPVARLSCHICIKTGTRLTPAASAAGLGSPLPHLHRDWAHPSHICTGT